MDFTKILPTIYFIIMLVLLDINVITRVDFNIAAVTCVFLIIFKENISSEILIIGTLFAILIYLYTNHVVLLVIAGELIYALYYRFTTY